MKEKRIVSISSAPTGSYAVIIESYTEPNNIELTLVARVLPVVGLALVEERATTTGRVDNTVMPLITDSISMPLRRLGGPHLLTDIFPLSKAWKTFAPGENGLRWAELWEQTTGQRIEHWDVRSWFPYKSPLSLK